MAKVEWTVSEAARRWGVSRTQVNKWRDQGRILWRWEPKFRRVVVLSSDRPRGRAPYGSLPRRGKKPTKTTAPEPVLDKATG
jgi:hypothetical protein